MSSCGFKEEKSTHVTFLFSALILSKTIASRGIVRVYRHSTRDIQIIAKYFYHEETNVLHMQKQKRRSADCSYCKADQHLCFRYIIHSANPSLSKSKISSL